MNKEDEFLVYLPECSIADIAREFVSWWGTVLPLDGERLPAGYYGIYDINLETSFLGMVEVDRAKANILDYIDLTGYLDDISGMYSIVGEKLSFETGDFENWYICNNIQYGNYYGSSKGDEISVDGSSYCLYEIYVGKNVDAARDKLSSLGWLCTDQTIF